jgi:hypothetical protein
MDNLTETIELRRFEIITDDSCGNTECLHQQRLDRHKICIASSECKGFRKIKTFLGQTKEEWLMCLVSFVIAFFATSVMRLLL